MQLTFRQEQYAELTIFFVKKLTDAHQQGKLSDQALKEGKDIKLVQEYVDVVRDKFAGFASGLADNVLEELAERYP